MKIHLFLAILTFNLMGLENLQAQEKFIHFALSDSGGPLGYKGKESKVKGIFPKIINLAFKEIDGYSAKFSLFPWGRAQQLVRYGDKEGLCTYASISRKKYAYFTKKPIYSKEYGYIIYNKNSSRGKEIQKVSKMRELTKFTFISQRGVGWEADNIPSYVKRNYVVKFESLFHMLFKRKSGDFFIMEKAEARYWARVLGYYKDLGIHKVSFIPNSVVLYSIGINKKVPNAKKIIDQLDDILRSKKFNEKREEIISKF